MEQEIKYPKLVIHLFSESFECAIFLHSEGFKGSLGVDPLKHWKQEKTEHLLTYYQGLV